MVSSCARPSGLELIWRVSHIIIMPMRSHASTHSGVGMLCEVRTALQPISLQHAETKPLQPIRHRRAHAGVVLMVAGALNLERFAVKEESLVGIEANRAHAKADALGVATLPSGLRRSLWPSRDWAIHRPERRSLSWQLHQ